MVFRRMTLRRPSSLEVVLGAFHRDAFYRDAPYRDALYRDALYRDDFYHRVSDHGGFHLPFYRVYQFSCYGATGRRGSLEFHLIHLPHLPHPLVQPQEESIRRQLMEVFWRSR